MSELSRMTDEELLSDPVFCKALVLNAIEYELDQLSNPALPVLPGLREDIVERAVAVLGDPTAVVAARRVTRDVMAALEIAAREQRDRAEMALLDGPVGGRA